MVAFEVLCVPPSLTIMRAGGQNQKDISPSWALSHVFELLAVQTAVDDVKLTNILIGLALDLVAGKLSERFQKQNPEGVDDACGLVSQNLLFSSCCFFSYS